MKKVLVILALFAFAAFADVPAMVPVTITWAPGTNGGPADNFFLHYNTDVAQPLTNWPVMLVVPGRTTVGTNSYVTTNCVIPILPGAYYFYLTASNFWGESTPSNQTNTPAPAVLPNLKTISR